MIEKIDNKYKAIMKSLCTTLDGWNLTDECDLFDFYTKDGTAILTMAYRDGAIKILDDVEYYSNTFYSNYENLTLKEYEERLQNGGND